MPKSTLGGVNNDNDWERDLNRVMHFCNAATRNITASYIYNRTRSIDVKRVKKLLNHLEGDGLLVKIKSYPSNAWRVANLFKTTILGQRRCMGKPMDEAVRLAYRDNIFKLLNRKPVIVDGVIQKNELNLTQEARELWQSFSDSFESKLGKGGEFEDIKILAATTPGQAARIAGNLHLALHVDAEEPWKILVSKETMSQGISCAEYLIAHAKNEFIAKMKKILEWMRNLGSNKFTQGQFYKALQEGFNIDTSETCLDFSILLKEDMENALECLIRRHYINEVQTERTFEISPHLK